MEEITLQKTIEIRFSKIVEVNDMDEFKKSVEKFEGGIELFKVCAEHSGTWDSVEEIYPKVTKEGDLQYFDEDGWNYDRDEVEAMLLNDIEIDIEE